MTQVLSATIRLRAPSGTSLETMVGVVGRALAVRVFSIRLHINSAIEITKCAPGRVGIATALVLAAEAFLSVLRYQVELLGELSTPPFFLLRLELALWLRSNRSVGSRPAQSCRVEAMGLSVTVSSLLVCTIDPPLV